jgi:hypothetical protein
MAENWREATPEWPLVHLTDWVLLADQCPATGSDIRSDPGWKNGDYPWLTR